MFDKLIDYRNTTHFCEFRAREKLNVLCILLLKFQQYLFSLVCHVSPDAELQDLLSVDGGVPALAHQGHGASEER